ncbi:MAG: LmeA family phospholipid-binding protein [Plectolyngbya sp. WJT66-NPBG17]|jgi:hypothetical protein|nr:LmeA family phospholipid-binding protein [Plectolyngbya sp. WJT66-NPBG17]MBW4526692.1 LmeA family phospholipid-binding protein [Phormidium tanganyikae FI6-MK23]
MAQEKTKFGEQAINKIAEAALSQRLKDVEQIRVRVKTDLNRLARGEVESIAIALQNLLLHQMLRVELLQLQIGLVVVKPLSALWGKIHLVQPSEGSLQLTIDQDALTDAINSAPFRERLHQRLPSEAEKAIKPRQVRCSIVSQDSIVFQFDDFNQSSFNFITVPVISVDRQVIELHSLRSPDQNLPLEFINAFVAQVSEVLNLREFARQGMSLQIQQLRATAGKLSLHATTRIEQFPSS